MRSRQVRFKLSRLAWTLFLISDIRDLDYVRVISAGIILFSTSRIFLLGAWEFTPACFPSLKELAAR